MSFGPGLILQKGWKRVFQTNTVPEHRVGPGFAGISNSTELGRGLGSLGCRPTGSSGDSSWESSGGASSGGGRGMMGFNYATESGSILEKKLKTTKVKNKTKPCHCRLVAK